MPTRTLFRPEHFSDINILEKAAYSTWMRGIRYYRGGRVQLVGLRRDHAILTVRGTSLYHVDFYYDPDEDDVDSDCTCPYAAKGYFCKHQVAAALYLREYLQSQVPDWENVLEQALTRPPKPLSSQPYILLFALENRYGSWFLTPAILPAKEFPEDIPGTDHPDFPALFHETLKRQSSLRSKVKPLRHQVDIHACVNCSPHVVSLAHLILKQNQSNFGYYAQEQKGLGEYLEQLREVHVPVFLAQRSPFVLAQSLAFLPGYARWVLDLQDTSDEGLVFSVLLEINGSPYPVEEHEIIALCDEPLWLLIDRTQLVPLSSNFDLDFSQKLLNLHNVEVPPKDRETFLEHHLPVLAEYVPVHHDRIQWEEMRESPVKRLYLTEEQGTLLVSLRFAYGGYEFPYSKRSPEIVTLQDESDPWHFIRVYRRIDEENAIYKSLSSARTGLKRGGLDYEDDIFLLRARVDPVDFLLRKVPILLEEGFEIYGEETLKQVRVNRHPPSISINVSSGIDWFDIQPLVTFGDIPVPLKDIRQALRRKERYIKLADGSIGELPENWIEKFKHLFNLGEETDEGVRLTDYHITLIDELIRDAENASTDQTFREKLERLQNFQGIEPKPLPKNFQGTLRDYQLAGYHWLHFLHDYGFGGILADDMGLGKTIQVLVFLLSLRESGHAKNADLIVVPRSLLVNWEREIEKFTPTLRVLRHFGPTRAKDPAQFQDYDIILTTYGTMRQDIKHLRDYTFHYAVLDESQAIKNPLSQTAKAARLLVSDHRLAMTGTPVENNAFELWSQFAFLNPGLLGGLEYFKREFATPIEKKKEQETAQLLRRMVYPFILRRTKDQVATELPPRTERILYCDMTPAQRRLYNKTRDQYRAMILNVVDDQGMNRARMKILEGLLRLRQISNHPKLVNPKFRGDSAKMELLLDELEQLRESGHKALVFSQFVGMLTLVRAQLDQRGIPYVYLDGRTRKRQDVVDRFQQDPDIPFFLISLKAGGVGLNLTAADYVIHIDPWWNPAVEMQATDRTHRIGQDKPVFVYKLITRDSVEEKILQLQERKRALVSQLITTESSFFKNLSVDDIAALFS